MNITLHKHRIKRFSLYASLHDGMVLMDLGFWFVSAVWWQV